MSLEQNGSVDLELSPENQGKYADYYAANDESSTDGNPEGASGGQVVSTAGTKTEGGEASAETPTKAEVPKPAKEHKPGWLYKLEKQKSEIRELRATVQKLQEPKVEKPVLKKENFVTEEEWVKHEARREAEELYDSRRVKELEEYTQAQQAQAQEEQFRNTWTQRAISNFEGDQEAAQDFAALVRDPGATEHLHQDIHDYVEDTPVGPRMLHVLLHRDDLVEEINNAKPIRRAALLQRLEAQVEAYIRGRNKPAAPATPAAPAARPMTRAPAPIGAVTTRGAALDEESAEKAQYDAYVKRKNGR